MVGQFLSIALLFLCVCVFSPSKYVLSLKECFLLPQLVLLHSIPLNYGFGAIFSQSFLVSRPHLFPERHLLP